MDDKRELQTERGFQMRNMRTIMPALLVATMLLTNCNYRPLEDEMYMTALIPVSIDWSESGVDESTMHRASVLLFPDGGGATLEYRLEDDLTYTEIEVPIGSYSVLIFNETTDASDWSSLRFTGTDHYETIAVEGLEEASRGFYTRSEELPLVKNPEPIAAWGMEGFSVTLDMITRTRAITRIKSATRSRTLAEEVTDLLGVKPQPRFEKMTVTARAANLASSMQITGLLHGMASGVYLASGLRMTISSSHALLLNGRVYDDNEKDGTTTTTINIYGKLPIASARYYLDLDFLLNDGTLHPRESFDITNMIERDTETIPVSNSVLVGFDDRDPDGGDHPIELPDMEVGSGGITVGDWNDVVIPLE
jgi:hypothetical protein